MRVRYLTCLAGADFVHNPGDVADLPDDQASRLAMAGIAEPVKVADTIETTVVPLVKVEHATVTPIPPSGESE